MADLRALKQIQDDREKRRQSALTPRLGTNARDAVGQIVSQKKIVPQFPVTEAKTTPALDTSTEQTTPKVESTGAALDTAVEPTEYEKAYQKQLDYMKQYMNREPFKYDVNADELYKIYQKQTLDAADKARRDATAQAAGLTGGYGSTYAAAVGDNAYNAQMQSLDSLRPALYEAALAQYQNEGAELLDKAAVAGQYGALLEGDNQDYASIYQDLFGGDTETPEGARTKYMAGSNNGITPYDGAIDLYLGNKEITADELRKTLAGWTYANGESLTQSDIEYIINDIANQQYYDTLSNLVDSNGNKLSAFIDELKNSDLSGEEVFDKLIEWRDANGDKLTSAEIAVIASTLLE